MTRTLRDEIEGDSDRSYNEATENWLHAIHREYSDGTILCTECGGPLELVPTRYGVEITCTECGYVEEEIAPLENPADPRGV